MFIIYGGFPMIDFHMVFSENMSELLADMAGRLGLSFSGVCRLFLFLGFQRCEQKFWKKGNRRSRWKPVDECTKRKHVLLDQQLYNRLMKLQTECNFYSKGQIARAVIGVVLIVVERRGLGFAKGFFDRGSKKYRRKSYSIGQAGKHRHMPMRRAVKTLYSPELEPIKANYP